MTTPRCTLALVLAAAFGCTDHATIGGLCIGDCSPMRDAATGTDDEDACAADGCKIDGGNPDPTCVDGSFELSRSRLDLMVVVDDTASTFPWWILLHDGLVQFLQDPASSGIGVGLQRFDEVCEPQAYADPLVPIAPLPANLAALQPALEPVTLPSTSTIPALDGVHQHARAWALSHPESNVAVVLLTDGSPGACDGLAGDFDMERQRIARAAFDATPSIKTYVVGFSILPGLDTLAMAGGTAVEMISVAPADGEVRAALERIRSDARSCTLRWQTGWTLAPNSEVVVTAANGSERRYPVLPSVDSCAQRDGLYIADATLVACPGTCGSLAATDRVTLPRICMAP